MTKFGVPNLKSSKVPVLFGALLAMLRDDVLGIMVPTLIGAILKIPCRSLSLDLNHDGIAGAEGWA